MKITVNETERGFLFKKGRFERMLMPGVYYVFGGSAVRKTSLAEPLHKVFDAPTLTAFKKDAAFVDQTVTQTVDDGHIALCYLDGRLGGEVLVPGRYVYWKNGQDLRFEVYETVDGEPVPEGIGAQGWKLLELARLAQIETVAASQAGILTVGGKLVRVLTPGTYAFWTGVKPVHVERMDLRRQELALNGQEILTKDKVGVRVNVVCSYRIADARKAYETSQDAAAEFYTQVQLAIRAHLSGMTLDELLLERDQIGEKLVAVLRPKAEALHLEVFEAGVRDIVLPGDVRDILNTVLLAEKKAQANVITRREEVASTRSLLNTAKLMDENKTLYKLKELEYLERICQNVGDLSVSGGDLLGQLRELLRGSAK